MFGNTTHRSGCSNLLLSRPDIWSASTTVRVSSGSFRIILKPKPVRTTDQEPEVAAETEEGERDDAGDIIRAGASLAGSLLALFGQKVNINIFIIKIFYEL